MMPGRAQAAGCMPTPCGAAGNPLVAVATELNRLVGLCRPACGMAHCFEVGTDTLNGDGRAKKAIDKRQILDMVYTYPGAQSDLVHIIKQESEKWKILRACLRKNELDVVEVALLRHVDELALMEAEFGAQVFLKLPEMGAVGWADVIAIEPCPPVPEGQGRLVTGTFKHHRGVLARLLIEGESNALGVTAAHPFWSVNRGDWMRVDRLSEGERLLGSVDSFPRVLQRESGNEPEPVYNIEVEGDHCYRVGLQGLLVHNASAGECGRRFQDMASWSVRGSTLRADVIHIHQGHGVADHPGSKTTAIAIIQLADCGWECVYAVSGGLRRNRNTDLIPVQGVRSRADTLGYRLVRGAGPHAEQKIIANLPAGAKLLAIAPCRPACTEEDTNRVEGTCTNDIQVQGQNQGTAVMLFNPLGSAPYCT